MSSGVYPMNCSIAIELHGIGDTAPQRALRLAGGARGVDHRRPGLRRRRDVRLVRRRGLHQLVTGDHPRRRRAVVDEVGRHAREVAADAFEHRRELGVDVHEDRVAVVGDVGGLLVAQPVVERHRRRTDLARGVDDRDDADRVLTAPDDLRVGQHAEVEQHVGEPVRSGLELAVGERQDIAARPVVDDARSCRDATWRGW